MTELLVDSMVFAFPSNWHVTKFDDWNFYRKKIQNVPGVGAIDIIAIAPDQKLFLIEVKDFRPRKDGKTIVATGSSELRQRVLSKVVGTLCSLLPAKLNAEDEVERTFASRALQATELKIVLHIEQPSTKSPLFPRAINESSLQLALRQALKGFDRYAKVVNSTTSGLPYKAVPPA